MESGCQSVPMIPSDGARLSPPETSSRSAVGPVSTHTDDVM